jgi:hypothetical protein
MMKEGAILIESCVDDQELTEYCGQRRYFFVIQKLPLYNEGKHQRGTNVCV